MPIQLASVVSNKIYTMRSAILINGFGFIFSATLTRLMIDFGFITCIDVVNARIIPEDDGLTVFPDVCSLQRDSNSANSHSKNCGIHRLDGMNNTWTLRSEDGVHEGIYAIVSQ